MQAIEFEAIIRNGMLEIPNSYKDFTNVKAKVVIMKEEDMNLNITKEEELSKLEQFKLFIQNNDEPDFDKDIDIDELTDTINEDNL